MHKKGTFPESVIALKHVLHQSHIIKQAELKIEC